MPTEQLVAGRADQDRPLVVFLADRLGISRRRAKALLDRRVVFVNQRRTWMARHLVRSGDRIEIIDAPTADVGPCPVLWRDGDLLAVDKPAGIEVTGTDGLEGRLRRELRDHALTAVHRLDRDTTGCLLFARSADAKAAMVALFRSRALDKGYRALAAGRIDAGRQTLRAPLDGKTAVTHLHRLRATETATHLKIRIETGRTHQIRRHLAGIGHPLLGDPMYATGPIDRAVLRSLPRPMLHAETLAFEHPHTGKPVSIQAPLPADFRQALKMLKLA